MQLKTEQLDELVRQLHESAGFLEFLCEVWHNEPGCYGLRLAAERLRENAISLDAAIRE